MQHVRNDMRELLHAYLVAETDEEALAALHWMLVVRLGALRTSTAITNAMIDPIPLPPPPRAEDDDFPDYDEDF